MLLCDEEPDQYIRRRFRSLVGQEVLVNQTVLGRRGVKLGYEASSCTSS